MQNLKEAPKLLAASEVYTEQGPIKIVRPHASVMTEATRKAAVSFLNWHYRTIMQGRAPLTRMQRLVVRVFRIPIITGAHFGDNR
jgi:hypothetical protein